MTKILAFSLCSTWLLIAIAHVYWALGGKIFSDRIYPSDTQKAAPPPETWMTLLAVAAFVVFAAISIMYAFPDRLLFSAMVRDAMALMLAGLCLLRGVGEFKYVGVFKRVKGTLFAKWDNILYTPLSFLLGILTLIMAMRT